MACLKHFREFGGRHPLGERQSHTAVNRIVERALRFKTAENVDAFKPLGPEFRQIDLERKVWNRALQAAQHGRLSSFDIDLDEVRDSVQTHEFIKRDRRNLPRLSELE